MREDKRLRMKSTAIMGALELEGKISDLRVKNDWLIMNLRTTTPAGWNLKAAISHSDLLTVARLMFRPRNILYVLFGFGKPREKFRNPEY